VKERENAYSRCSQNGNLCGSNVTTASHLKTETIRTNASDLQESQARNMKKRL